MPPAFGASQISPPYTKLICDVETSGYLNNLASTWADAETILKQTNKKKNTCFINSN
jgi:hypothetical protein